MSIPLVTRNEALSGIVVDALSLHFAFPGVIGANEVTGGGYARKAVTLGVESGGQRVTTAAVLFDVPALTVSWIGMWGGAIFKGAMANGGATPKNFMAISTDDTIYSSGHGYANSTKIAFFNGSPPGGLVEGTVYFTRDVTADTFKVAATAGGAVIDLSGTQSFGCVMCAVVEDVYSSPGTHQVIQISIAVPN